MKVKERAKTLLATNAKLNKYIYEHTNVQNHQSHIKCIDEYSQYDYFDSIEPLKEYMKSVQKGQISFFTTDANWSNSHIYGIYYALFGQQEDIIRTPSIEHGLIFHNDIFTDTRYTSRPSCVSLSNFRKAIIRSYTNRPVFTVGSYIDYAKVFYDDSKMNLLKQDIGKTLLVFPTHTTNSAELTVNQQKFLDNLKELAKGYDTVLINGYFWNINDPLINRLEAEGFKIVSCGLRDDVHFMERLKAYITLADAVAGDGIGTHIGYALSMNKPFIFLDSDVKVSLGDSREKKDVSFVEYHQNRIRQCFENTYEITPQQRALCNYYWGGDCHKESHELQTILDINSDIYELTSGCSSKIENAIHMLLNRYIVDDEEKYRLLFDAI